MEMQKAEAIIEAILFTMGEAVEVSKIAMVIEEDIETTKNIIHNMQDNLEKDNRGIKIVEMDQSFQLCTKGDYYEYLIKIAKTPKKNVLTETMLETLSIIAYKQPVTRLELEKIRGVNCDHSVNRLLEFELVKELGRLDAPGRPLLFGTTEQFLRSFGVESIKELPVLDRDQIETFKLQAEEEIQLKMGI